MLIYKRVETIKIWVICDIALLTLYKGTYAGHQDFVHMIFPSDVGLSSKFVPNSTNSEDNL